VCPCTDFAIYFVHFLYQLIGHDLQNSVTSSCNQCLAHCPMPIQLVSDEGRRQLQSETLRTCVIRRTYSNYGDGCFAAAGPKLWNSLPAELQQTDISFQQFKRLLKTFLFGCQDPGTLWLTVKAARHKLSYLLTYLITFLELCLGLLPSLQDSVYWSDEPIFCCRYFVTSYHAQFMDSQSKTPSGATNPWVLTSDLSVTLHLKFATTYLLN